MKPMTSATYTKTEVIPTCTTDKAFQVLNWEKSVSVSDATVAIHDLVRNGMFRAENFLKGRQGFGKREILAYFDFTRQYSHFAAMMFGEAYDTAFGVDWELFRQWREVVEKTKTSEPRYEHSYRAPLSTDIFGAVTASVDKKATAEFSLSFSSLRKMTGKDISMMDFHRLADAVGEFVYNAVESDRSIVKLDND